MYELYLSNQRVIILFLTIIWTFQDQETKGQLARLTFARIARSLPRDQHIKLGLLICKYAFPQKIPDNVSEIPLIFKIK